MQTDSVPGMTAKAESRKRRARANKPDRGIFEKALGSGVWWIRYVDAEGRYRREKAGTWGNADKLLTKRKNEALQGKKLPEILRRAPVTFREIAADDGLTVVCSLHQVDLALGWGDRIVGLRHGEVVLNTPALGLSKEQVMEIYGRVATTTTELTAIEAELVANSREAEPATLTGTVL